MHVDCLERRRRVLGEDHPDTLDTVGNLAFSYNEQGKYEKAEPLYVDCLERRRLVLGEDHPRTLLSINNLAASYINQRKYDMAEPLLVHCLERRRGLLDHPDTLRSISNLAVLYNDQGKYDKAEPLYVDCLERRRGLLGEDHPRTLASINNLAFLYDKQGKFEKAEPMHVECLERMKRVLGEDHPRTQTSRNNLARLYKAQGKYEKAEPLLMEEGAWRGSSGYPDVEGEPCLDMLLWQEGYGDTAAFSNKPQGRECVHMLMSSLFCTEQALPLPLISSNGVTIELFLAPVESLFISPSVAYYEISSIKFNWLSIVPDVSYTTSLRAAVASGRSCYIPFQRVYQTPSVGNGSSSNILQIGTKQVSSVAGVDIVAWSSADYSDRSKDKGLRFLNLGITEFSLMAGGVAQPSQLTFKYGLESIMIRLLSQSGNGYLMHKDVSLPATYDTSLYRISFDFQTDSETFGSGLSTISSGQPYITATINTAPGSPILPSTNLMAFVYTDALLVISGAEIQIQEVF
ncbi:hypothetical protein HK104_004830 [Borealophlyctis nickersoniae]|nr:hypothetical protein HK104_004830 [Borealophlyctis nickersoniae]